MRFTVMTTDIRWFNYLRAAGKTEVNFWKPNVGGAMRGAAGTLLAFKLKTPIDRIGGFGFCVSYTELPLSLAWHNFGDENGAPDFDTFRRTIVPYIRGDRAEAVDPPIGCYVVCDVIWLDNGQFIEPRGFARNIVSGRYYDSAEGDGRYLLDALRRHMSQPAVSFDATSARYADPVLTTPRLGQGAFRTLVTDAYRRCAATGEKTLTVLEAAHIRPYAQNGPHAVNNGLLLRSDVHRLFDLGYMTVRAGDDPRDLRLHVSRRIREEYGNGRIYYDMDGAPLKALPVHEDDLPDRALLQWHNEAIFRE